MLEPRQHILAYKIYCSGFTLRQTSIMLSLSIRNSQLLEKTCTPLRAMAAIGSFEYPKLGVDEALSAANRILATLGGGSFDRGALAAALGHQTIKSGAFSNKVADLQKYGLIDGRGDSIRATETAHKIVMPATPMERQEGLREMLHAVPLFRDIHQSLRGRRPQKEELFPILLNLTKADRPEVQKHLDMVHSRYVELASKIEGGTLNFSGPDFGTSSGGAVPESTGAPGAVSYGDHLAPQPSSSQNLRIYQQGDVYVRAPDSIDALEEVADIIAVWIKRAKRQAPHDE